MNDIYRVHTSPQCSPGAVVEGDCYRFTILTPKLLRLEYDGSGRFEDGATQTVWNRGFPVPEFRVKKDAGTLTLETGELSLTYREGPFYPGGLSIRIKNGAVWHYGADPDDLGGTARTLDEADGAIPLGHGLLSRAGYAVLDDSRSMTLAGDGWVKPRPEGTTDLYFFGYGHAYQECIRDFYRLCGNPPLLPRWAFGNWWCRYHKYAEPEYKELVERFERERVPFSVAVIDMDWHLVDVDPKYGTGWTGYTWNTELFPDPPEFLEWLHRHGLKVSLNLHPADGVRAYEKPYAAMAREMGADAARGEPVPFDPADPRFLEAYFRYLHHPLEDEGVDFWWIDWQQGSVCRIPGLDPLWMLNHYHYLDSGRRGRRPVVFSRYAGVGSHRYPVGFSGDTVVSWESLRFQPYFTATASNVGYGWWSHDIGGHMHGYKDDELAARWVQFGVFSPILRLHSTANSFNSKEPWRFGPAACAVMEKFLRLRHRLVPYLYSMNRRASREGLPLLRPMYWLEPERDEAYEVPNEYSFGTELIAAPVTEPADRSTLLGRADAWLPEGLWFDVFENRAYRGGRTHALWRPLQDIPVLAKAGAVVPLADPAEYTSAVENPAALEVRVYPGAEGSFDLWEDPGDTPEDRDENWACTAMRLSGGLAPCFTIRPAAGNLAAIPQSRRWTVRFCCAEDSPVTVLADGKAVAAEIRYDAQSRSITAALPELPAAAELRFVCEKGLTAAKNPVAEETRRLLDRAQMPFDLKERIQRAVEHYGADCLPALDAMNLEKPLLSALCEVLLA